METLTAIKFEGIDRWNRPIFKSLETKSRYGSVDHLFNDDSTEDDVLAIITEKDLLFFGNNFGCEPMGDPTKNLKIVRMFKKGDKVKISEDGLEIHSRSIPAHMGHTQETIDWRISLLEIKNASTIGEIERTFPNSAHINVIFNGKCYGVDGYMIEKI